MWTTRDKLKRFAVHLNEDIGNLFKVSILDFQRVNALCSSALEEAKLFIIVCCFCVPSFIIKTRKQQGSTDKIKT